MAARGALRDSARAQGLASCGAGVLVLAPPRRPGLSHPCRSALRGRHRRGALRRRELLHRRRDRRVRLGLQDGPLRQHGAPDGQGQDWSPVRPRHPRGLPTRPAVRQTVTWGLVALRAGQDRGPSGLGGRAEDHLRESSGERTGGLPRSRCG